MALGEDSLYLAEQIRGREWLGDRDINTFIKASLLVFTLALAERIITGMLLRVVSYLIS